MTTKKETPAQVKKPNLPEIEFEITAKNQMYQTLTKPLIEMTKEIAAAYGDELKKITVRISN